MLIFKIKITFWYIIYKYLIERHGKDIYIYKTEISCIELSSLTAEENSYKNKQEKICQGDKQPSVPSN